MKNLVPLACTLGLLAIACAGSSTEPDRYPATLRAGVNLDDAPPCDVDTTCPDGLSCAYIDLDGDDPGARCVDLESICDQLDCGDGDCLVRESYPVQIGCAASDGPGDDGDDGDDTTVSQP